MDILVWLINVNPTPLHIWKSEILGIFPTIKTTKTPRTTNKNFGQGENQRENTRE